jgi:hypothetical protein
VRLEAGSATGSGEAARFVPPPRPVPHDDSWVLDYRRWTLGLAAALAFMEGLSEAFQGPDLIALVALAGASTCALYAALDARALGKPYPRTFQWAMFFTWPVGMLVHLFWTRRWRGIGIYLLMWMLALMAAGAGYALGRLLATL